MNEFKDKNGDTWSQGGAGGAHFNKSQNERDIKKGINGIAWFLVTLFGKPKTTGQKVMKVILWVLTLTIIGFIVIPMIKK